MTQSHYSLRWNNHQAHILAAFEALLHAEALVDVTLVCAETSVRAHKVVLSACSPFFERIFSENPCKHPVIVLKDFRGWEMQAVVDFMYKGEISVGQEQLQSLMRAAESLQVRGLVSEDGGDKGPATIVNQTLTPSTSPNEFDGNCLSGSRFSNNTMLAPRTLAERMSPFSPIATQPEPPHLPRAACHEGYPHHHQLHQRAESPVPRRKQSRPRRRSGELHHGPQDLSAKPGSPEEEPTAEDLCTKRRAAEFKMEEEPARSPMESPEPDLGSGGSKEFAMSPGQMQPPMVLKHEMMESHSPLSFPPMPSMAALAMTPPHSKYFGVDSPLGLFPPGLDGRNTLFDMSDPRATNDPQMFAKKKMGRPKGQHSAPRGGPPRSWTNAELTEALQQVWNKKMTTSQASRIFGIPYNSLLMYVRGKYGKSLKLEKLRKDCTGAPATPTDAHAGSPNHKGERDQEPAQPMTRPPSAEDQPQPAIFNPFQHNFYQDFGSGFPIPVSMIHLLPQQGDRPAMEAYPPPHQVQLEGETREKAAKVVELDNELYRSAMGGEENRDSMPPNGQN